MSCPREMRPVPIAPMLRRLLGDVAPKTELGTIAGKPAATVVAPTPLATSDRSFRRETTRRLGDMDLSFPDRLPISYRERSGPRRVAAAEREPVAGRGDDRPGEGAPSERLRDR